LAQARSHPKAVKRMIWLTVLTLYTVAQCSVAMFFSTAGRSYARYYAAGAGVSTARVAKWDTRVKDDLALGYQQRIYPSAATPDVQPFLFFPAGKDYWYIHVRLENASEVAANCTLQAQVKHTPATAEISGGCTKANGHTDVCSNVPAIEVTAITAGYTYGVNGVNLPVSANPAVPASCEVQIKIPRTTCTNLQIFAYFVQID
jgi:hypothetical protein